MIDIKEVNKKINTYKNKGEVQKAIEYCQSVLLQEPGNPDINIKLGDLYMDWHLDIYQAKQYIDEAITQYQKACELLVDNGEIYYKIGFAFYHKGELDRAQNYFEMALEHGANKAQCHYMLANCYNKKEHYADALKEVNIALSYSFLNTSRIHYLKSKLIKASFFNKKHVFIKQLYEIILSLLTLPFDAESKKTVSRKLKVLSIFLKF